MPKATKKKTSVKFNPIDIYAGEQLRLFRQEAGLNQTELAHAVGVTFQQLQKYEKGANRISLSRLCMLSDELGVNPILFFTEQYSEGGESKAIKILRNHIKNLEDDLDNIRKVVGK